MPDQTRNINQLGELDFDVVRVVTKAFREHFEARHGALKDAQGRRVTPYGSIQAAMEAAGITFINPPSPLRTTLTVRSEAQ